MWYVLVVWCMYSVVCCMCECVCICVWYGVYVGMCVLLSVCLCVTSQHLGTFQGEHISPFLVIVLDRAPLSSFVLSADNCNGHQEEESGQQQAWPLPC